MKVWKATIYFIFIRRGNYFFTAIIDSVVAVLKVEIYSIIGA